MKRTAFFLAIFITGTFCAILKAQTYIQGTSDSSSGNQSLVHNNTLKIGNSATTAERAKNMLKIGDGDFIQIGEWEADDLLSFKASKFNFTNGYVGIGTSSPTANLEVYGSYNPSFILRGTTTRLQIGVPSSNGSYTPYAVPGDVVFRPLGSVNGRFGLIFNLPTTNGDGKSTIKFGDDKNGEWFVLSNNKIACLDGKLGIGTNNPQSSLDVNGIIRAKEVKIETDWADFVFRAGYRLPSLTEVKNHIETNKHLPDIPTEAEVKENGVNLGEMQVKLLQKIEELTLYVIQQQEQLQQQQTTIQQLQSEINQLKK